MISKQNKEKCCIDCGGKVEGKHVRCKECAKKTKLIQTVNSNNRTKKKNKSKKQLRSMNGNLPLKRGILADLMANGLY